MYLPVKLLDIHLCEIIKILKKAQTTLIKCYRKQYSMNMMEGQWQAYLVWQCIYRSISCPCIAPPEGVGVCYHL